jgi:hypothetical protein
MNRATPPPDLTMRPSQLPMPEAHTLLNGLRVLTLPTRARLWWSFGWCCLLRGAPTMTPIGWDWRRRLRD